MDMDDIESCNICMDFYDQDVRPHCLPCGHSICGTCITNSIKNGRLKCPQCQQSHEALSANSFPISYGMEAVISQMRKIKLGALPKDYSSNVRRPLPSGGKWKEVFNDQKDSLRNLLADSDNIEVDMSQYKDFLHQKKIKHDQIISQIYDLAKQHEEVVKQIGDEDKILTGVMKERNEHKKTATETLCKYDQVTSTIEFAEGSDEIGSCCNTFEEWKRRSQMMLPNAKTIKTSHKLLRDTTAALKEITSEDQESTRETLDISSLDMSIMNKIKMVERKVTVPMLQKRSKTMKNSLDKGHIYAIQNELGRTRCARITLSNDKVYLHHLQDREPPVNALTIKYSELIECLNKDGVTVFMSMKWKGSVQGRLHILLSPDTPLARHFRCLCCGEFGPSYAHSTLLQVWNKGDNTGECVSGGDYETKDGNGGAPLMKGLNPGDAIYTRNREEGVVCTSDDDQDGPKISQFIILSGKGNSSSSWDGVFGRVKEGLQTLREAAKLDDIRQVIIDDCGVILDF